MKYHFGPNPPFKEGNLDSLLESNFIAVYDGLTCKPHVSQPDTIHNLKVNSCLQHAIQPSSTGRPNIIHWLHAHGSKKLRILPNMLIQMHI